MKLYLILADGARYEGLFADFHTTFWSAVLRMVEAIVAAAPFLIAGVFVAGILRGMVGGERMRNALGVGQWSGPIRAWALGILLPVCSLGALPVARELRRAGVPSGTVLSFVLVAPVLNPVSIIYGLSHINPFTLLYFAAGTFLVSTGIGFLWNRVISSHRDRADYDSKSLPAGSMVRLSVAWRTTAHALVGPNVIDYSLALLAVGLLGAFLPHGSLQTGLTRENLLSPIIMGAVAIPVYVTPTEVMMHFGLIVRDGYSMGAAFALIILGAGANVGVANWVRRDYGFKPLMLFVTLLLGATLVIGFTADRTILLGNAQKTDHTHAFDSFTRMHRVQPDQANVWWVVEQVSRDIKQHEIYGLTILGLLTVTGIIVSIPRFRVDIDSLLVGRSDQLQENSSKWDATLSTGQLIFAGVAIVLVLAVIGIFVFYPSIDNLHDVMIVARLKVNGAVLNGDDVEARRFVAQWRRQAVKLPTSQLLRHGQLTDEQREMTDELLHALDTLDDYLTSGERHEVLSTERYAADVYSQCMATFRTN